MMSLVVVILASAVLRWIRASGGTLKPAGTTA
jgi:hypothetical protein